ncbi:hypothetical protein [Gloeocapsopsis dulcis]|uniref:Low temperature-induced protein n=1 Tax=Gloeocapsopsis dulcis AAB1 = 1H9 TaxID=1433147 RepID=A0A6N8FR59_9CHRO|nr:hypothetical protein [Gloeocapsopsis dulcis]MUL35264.1 hypothetical protein [Gloeocapsopsis dulcis AAB1 = 1H9]WNN89145.1 hypothetical protein P0S91_23325 [Gloeocapsopsis dulcis]
MKRSWLQRIKLRQIVTVFLVALAFMVSTAMQVQAEPVTPEATSYQIDRVDSQGRPKAEKLREETAKEERFLEEEGYKPATKTAAEKAQDKNKGVFENIKDKLNLDEPIDPGTKKAAEQIKEAVTGK